MVLVGTTSIGGYMNQALGGPKDPNRRYVPKTLVTIPNIETLHTPYWGLLDP